MINELAVFTDGSLNSKLAIGFGASLIIPKKQLQLNQLDKIKAAIKVKKFKVTSSTRLEMESLLWALRELIKNNKVDKLIIYTDSQCIVGLQDRREQLERMAFKSGKTKQLLNNADLYQKFYNFSDKLNFEVIKVKGHTKQKEKDILQMIFSQVDKISRKKLKKYLELEQCKC